MKFWVIVSHNLALGIVVDIWKDMALKIKMVKEKENIDILKTRNYLLKY